MKRYLVLIVLIGVFLGMGIAARLAAINNSTVPVTVTGLQKANGIPVEVVQPARKAIHRELKLLGSIAPVKKLTISARLDERIVESSLKLGQKVAANELLVRLFDGEITLQSEMARGAALQARATVEKLKSGARPQEVRQSEAGLKSAQAVFDNAKNEFERMKSLKESGAIPQQKAERIATEHENARNALESAKQGLQLVREGARKEDILAAEGALIQAEANYERMKIQLDYTRIHSPIEGYVSEYYKEIGEQADKNKPLFVVIDLNTLFLLVDVPEKEISQLGKGTEVIILSDRVTDQTFRGAVEEVSPDADPISRTFPVKIRFNNENLRLKPGMLASAKIPVNSKLDALAIPRDCLVTRQDKTGVFLVKGGKADFQEIRPIFYGEEVDVTDVLPEGVTVILQGQKNLMPGDAVQIAGK